MIARADAMHLPFADQSVDCVVGSPPYCDARLYLEGGQCLGISRDAPHWVMWMLIVSREALRVSRGPVVWVCASVVRKRNYQPAVEGLAWEWYRWGGHAERTVYWHRHGIPGSGGDQGFRADIEYVLVLKRPGKLPYANPLVHGKPPKYGPGGEMSYRGKDGVRRNQRGGSDNMGRRRRANGERQESGPRPSHRFREAPDGSVKGAHAREICAIANPGNLIRGIKVGGGNMGHPLAHENEAPYPQKLAEWLLDVWCPPGGLVLDPFSGSGTTVAAAIATGRRGIGTDLRMSQCELARRRLKAQQAGMF